jgi:hypothetical protein
LGEARRNRQNALFQWDKLWKTLDIGREFNNAYALKWTSRGTEEKRPNFTTIGLARNRKAAGPPTAFMPDQTRLPNEPYLR